MCGICGYTGPVVPGLLERMSEAIRHRGPDAGGEFSEGPVHLANRRLRVLDLEGGDQPLYNEDGSVVVVYNGEIYNYRELRRSLEEKGHRFSTNSDTEVIVHLYEEQGIHCARELNGMFAFALYDRRRERLLLARDPVGIKPIVYHWNGRSLVFGSEAKCVIRHPEVSPALDSTALHHLLNVRFVPAPRTLFAGIEQLRPGHSLVFEGGAVKVQRYHDWRFDERRAVSAEDAAASFEETLVAAVKRQMVADVPLGLFLSGGLDSSSILAAADLADRDRNAGPVRTFSLGFDEPRDELDDARLMADHFGSRHRATTLHMRALELFPRVVYHAEMPKVNATQGYYLSRFARQDVTVALSGLGGDELFLGYELYKLLGPGRQLIDGLLGNVVRPLRGALDGAALAFDRLSGPRGDIGRRLLELVASAKDPLRYYLTLRNGWDLGPAVATRLYTDSWRAGLEESTRDAFAPYFDQPHLPLVDQVQWAEFQAKMVDDFLLNEDRMSMASSLEVRVPLLDLEMVRFAFSLPLAVKFEKRQLKPVIKRSMQRHLPPEILRKKKWGFTFDSHEQYRKDLRDLCMGELSREFVEEQGIFRYEFLRQIFDTQPSKWMRWHYFMIWKMLGLKFWQEMFLEGRSAEEIEARLAASSLNSLKAGAG